MLHKNRSASAMFKKPNSNESALSESDESAREHEHTLPQIVSTPPSQHEAQWNNFLQEHSPLGPAERFFLPSLSTSGISAHALAESIRRSSRGELTSGTSDRTDDFVSCVSASPDSSDSDLGQFYNTSPLLIHSMPTNEYETIVNDEYRVILPDINPCNSNDAEKTKNSMSRTIAEDNNDFEVWAYGINDSVKNNQFKSSEGGISANAVAESLRKSALKSTLTPVMSNYSKNRTPCNSLQESEMSLLYSDKSAVIVDDNMNLSLEKDMTRNTNNAVHITKKSGSSIKSRESETLTSPNSITQNNGINEVKDVCNKLHLKNSQVDLELLSPNPSKSEGTYASIGEEDQYHVSQQIYDSLKAVWGYGSSIRIAKPFLKVTENVADKVLHYATGMHINNENENEIIKPKLLELDEKIVNPAIIRLLHVLAPMQDKVDDKLRPVVGLVIRKLYYINYFHSSKDNN